MPSTPSPLRLARREQLSGLYAIADDSFASTPDQLLRLIDAFLRGGARLIQLRCKQLGTGAQLAVSRAAAEHCHERRALFFINDRPDLAALANADGVHLGQEDFPAPYARALLGPDALITISTHTDLELDAAIDPAKGREFDGVGFGPAFATQTKIATAPGSVPLPAPHGIDGVRRAVLRAKELKLIAIGGIDEARAEELAAAGAACVAVISELCAASDPEAKTRALLQAFARGARRK